MVGHDHESGRARASHDPANRAIYPLIGFEKLVVVLAPQHVRILIERGEIEEQQPGLKLVHGLPQQGKLIVRDERALRQIVVQVEVARAIDCGVFGDALRVVRTDRVRQLAAVRIRSGNGQRGSGGIQVHRRHVELQVRMILSRVNPKHAPHRLESGNERELGVDPRGPFVLVHDEQAVAQAEPRRRLPRVDVDSHRDGSLGAVFAQRVRRTGNSQHHVTILWLHLHDLSAGDVVGELQRVVGVERECAERALQIGHAHASKRLGFAW